MSKVTVVGGKLKLKGSSSSTIGKKRKQETEVSSDDVKEAEVIPLNVGPSMTETERRHREKREKSLEKDLKKLTGVSYRERLDRFNDKLSKMTEHNDIPRISAAGNG